MFPTFSCALRASCSTYSCISYAPGSTGSRASRAFSPQALVPHVSCALRLSCLTYLVPYLLSCSRVSCLTCSCTSLCVLVYLAQHTIMHLISRSSWVLYLLCFCCFRYLSFFPVWATVNDYDMQLPLIYIYLITLIYQLEFVTKEL